MIKLVVARIRVCTRRWTDSRRARLEQGYHITQHHQCDKMSSHHFFRNFVRCFKILLLEQDSFDLNSINGRTRHAVTKYVVEAPGREAGHCTETKLFVMCTSKHLAILPRFGHRLHHSWTTTRADRERLSG